MHVFIVRVCERAVSTVRANFRLREKPLRRPFGLQPTRLRHTGSRTHARTHARSRAHRYGVPERTHNESLTSSEANQEMLKLACSTTYTQRSPPPRELPISTFYTWQSPPSSAVAARSICEEAFSTSFFFSWLSSEISEKRVRLCYTCSSYCPMERIEQSYECVPGSVALGRRRGLVHQLRARIVRPTVQVDVVLIVRPQSAVPGRELIPQSNDSPTKQNNISGTIEDGFVICLSGTKNAQTKSERDLFCHYQGLLIT